MQKIAILYDASQAALSTFDSNGVLMEILGTVRDYFQIENGAIYLADRDKPELHLKEHFGKHAEAPVPVLKFGEGLIGSAAKMKRPVYVPDVNKDPRYLKSIASTVCELAVPLMVRDEVVGVMDFQSDHADFFDNETIDMLTLFSTQASIAIENARLYTLEQRRARQLEAINAIARQTTAIVEVDQLLKTVCEQISQRFNIDHVAVVMWQAGELKVKAMHGKLTPLVKVGDALPENTGLSYRALTLAETIIEGDVDHVVGYVKGFKETKSEMCVPMIFFGDKIGVLALDSARENAFDASDVQPLESVADICAAAIKNTTYFEQAQQLAFKDGLTGIFNRRFFELRIAEELERANRYAQNLAVVMLDIDNFKKLNDEFGHLLGDEVLRQVSQILNDSMRKGDVVCRYGGEEFALLLPQASPENAVEAAEKVRRNIEQYHFPGVPRRVTISCGVAGHPEFGRTRDEIVAAADAALYAAKQAGRNKVVNAEQARKTSA